MDNTLKNFYNLLINVYSTLVAFLFEHPAYYAAIDVKIGANSDLIQSTIYLNIPWALQ
jgi:hypothetical protein